MNARQGNLAVVASLACTMVVTAAGRAAQDAPNVDQLGPGVGDTAPAFSLPDQTGTVRSFESLMGRDGLILVFGRSVDRCPYTRSQLVELQGRQRELERRGFAIAVVTPDPIDTLARFAGGKALTYPLLSDEGATVIDEYGIRNATAESGGGAGGVPHPGTFLLDRTGSVVARSFEPADGIRRTASSLIVRNGPPLDSAADSGVRIEAPNLDLTVYASDAVAAPGQRFSLVLDLAPLQDVHVYAPPQESYQAISLELEPVPGLERHPMTFPPSEEYHFVPLDERVQVYMRPFRLIQDVHFAVSDELTALSEDDRRPVTIRGTLSYQACDDRLCYPPEDVPVAWSVEIKGLESDVP